MDISVVVPVYLGEPCLDELCRRLEQTIASITMDYEIILVDDRSPDASWDVMMRLAHLNKRIKIIRLSRNFGQHCAITAGLDFTTGDWTIVMDCDFQDPPEAIYHLHKEALKGFDIVLARRVARQHTKLKRLTSFIYYKIFTLISGMSYDGSVGNFRIMHRRVVTPLVSMREELRFFGGLVDWLGFKVGTIDVQHGERYAGKSSYNFIKLCRLGFHFALAHSDRPLFASVILGFSISSLSFCLGTYFIFRKLAHGISIEGWASITVAIFFMSGLILSSLGMLGIYVGKIFSQTKGRPIYVVDRALNIESFNAVTAIANKSIVQF